MSGYGSLYQPYLHMERMISECTSFQSMTGSADATEALDRIRFIASQDYDPATGTFQLVPMPRVTIWNMNPSKTRTSSGGGGGGYMIAPRMLVSLEIEIPDSVGASENLEFRYCGPLIEALEDEIASLGMVPGNLHIVEVNYLQTPAPCDPTENQGRRIWATDMEFVCAG